MKTTGTVFNIVRTTALVALLAGPFTSLSARPAVAAPAAPPDDPHIALLQQIWLDAWGLAYSPGQSGMTIYPIVGDEWIVLVSDSGATEDPFVDQGIFIQSGPTEYVPEFSWDQELLDAAGGLLSVEHSFVSGTLYGSTAWEGQIYAVVTEMVAPGENPGDPPLTVQVLTPVAFPTAMIGGQQDNRFTPQLPFTTGDDLQVDCSAIWNVCRGGCQARAIGEGKSCNWITAGCLVGCAIVCSAANFGYLVCLTICTAGCAAHNAGCIAKARGEYDQCNAGCDAARMTCEPGWVPPATN